MPGVGSRANSAFYCLHCNKSLSLVRVSVMLLRPSGSGKSAPFPLPMCMQAQGIRRLLLCGAGDCNVQAFLHLAQSLLSWQVDNFEMS